jgi:uncharacterized membrane protein
VIENKTDKELNKLQNIFRLSAMILIFTVLNLLFKYFKTQYEYYLYSILFLATYTCLLIYAKHKYYYYSYKLKLTLLVFTVCLAGLLIFTMYLK